MGPSEDPAAPDDKTKAVECRFCHDWVAQTEVAMNRHRRVCAEWPVGEFGKVVMERPVASARRF